MSKKTTDVKDLCPWCHSGDITISGQTVCEGEYITFECKCNNCGKPLQKVYKYMGLKTNEEFEEAVGKYKVTVVIEGITTKEYAENYSGNEQTKSIMALYNDKTYPLRSVYERVFINEEDALGDFQRHASFHENENGDAMNIALIQDEREHDHIIKREIMKCRDGHHIKITLSY